MHNSAYRYNESACSIKIDYSLKCNYIRIIGRYLLSENLRSLLPGRYKTAYITPPGNGADT